MLLVAGLGNPGAEYARTRHNVGFMVVDRLFALADGRSWKTKHKGDFAEVAIDGQKLALLKPQTFMNHSGFAVAMARSSLKLDWPQMLVVHDELDLPFADLRLKVGGGHGGHNGLRSIIEQLGGADFARLRFGVGHPGKGADVTGYVLGRFLPEQASRLPAEVERAAAAVCRYAKDGADAAARWLSESKQTEG